MVSKKQASHVLALIKGIKSKKKKTHVVITDARRPQSPIHSCFEWNTKVASYKYWEAQADQLMNEVYVLVRQTTAGVVRHVACPAIVPVPAGKSTCDHVEASAIRGPLRRELLDLEVRQARGVIERVIRMAFTYNLHVAYKQKLHAAVDAAYTDVMTGIPPKRRRVI